jgi:hypothetical protein
VPASSVTSSASENDDDDELTDDDIFLYWLCYVDDDVSATRRSSIRESQLHNINSEVESITVESIFRIVCHLFVCIYLFHIYELVSLADRSTL